MTQGFPVMGVVRHRMGVDGSGVTTLVGAYGCPLRCRYCLNAACWGKPRGEIMPQQLYDRVRVDDLYFQATGGGVTFGGGEPLLYAEFIHAFRGLCGDAWKINAETCLNVEQERLLTVIEDVDCFIVDIKDIDPDIYKSYTGQDNGRMIENLSLLAARMPQKLHVRVPLIQSYNTEDDIRKSIAWLQERGIQQIEVFPYRIKSDKSKD